ncbi:TPA: M50 family metallopeptidase [Staphylococcus aureus]
MKKIYINVIYNVLFYEVLFILLIITSYISKNDTLILISNLILVSILVVIIHELGHFIIGKIQGMSLFMISLVSVIFIKNKFHFSFPVFLALGATNMYKDNWKEGLKVDKLMWYALGGPIFNVLTIVIICLLKLIFESFYLDTFLVLNIVVLLVTSLPFIKCNDGYNFLELLMKKENSNFYKSYLSNSIYMSKTLNIYNHQELFFKISDTFTWNVVYLNGVVTGEVMKMSMKQAYNNKYEQNIIDLYLVGLGIKSEQEMNFDSISPVYGKCLYYLKLYMNNKEEKYLNLVSEHIHELLDTNQINIVENVIKNHKEVYDEN